MECLVQYSNHAVQLDAKQWLVASQQLAQSGFQTATITLLDIKNYQLIVGNGWLLLAKQQLVIVRRGFLEETKKKEAEGVAQ